VGSSHIWHWPLPLPLLAVVALGSGVTLSLVNNFSVERCLARFSLQGHAFLQNKPNQTKQ
jgi:hypothetical protein